MPAEEPRFVPKVHPLSRPMEEEDPLELMGFHVPGDPREMARCVIEEFLELGYSPQDVRAMFHSPEFPALNAIRKYVGTEVLEQILQQCAAVYGQFRIRVQVFDGGDEGPEVVPLRNPFGSQKTS